MNRTKLYPDQIIDESKLIIGPSYDFITFSNSGGRCHGSTYKFGGIFKDSSKGKEWVEDQLKMFTGYLNPFSFFTIHMDGVIHCPSSPNGFDKGRLSTIIYWKKGDMSWDNLSTFFGNIAEQGPRSHAVVPSERLKDDQAIHTIDPSINENAADWEKRMRAKKDDAMRKMLGYDR